ncbi:flagellar brake protein [Crassaminicella thermophila]|uniref:Flagellar brake protein n=1 Tax=Crassaminicella thermophila TaxID=2599308 RepID=A0A5C0SCK2_CRATE|nr:flagellar brake protein [Crassaminicella thermophila]QEK12255.1 flagellar brake protein [Crassaminicella thermophila]
MRKTDLPDIGDKINIDLLDNKIISENKKLVSQIIDKIDDYSMLIATPIFQNVIIPISVGEIIKISYSKKSLGVYGFKAKIIGRKNVSDISYLKVKRIGEIFRVQRREFYRLEILLNTQIRTIEDGNEKTIYALTKDISGGGLRVISKEELKVGSFVQIKIENNDQPINVQGEILRCSQYEESNYNFEIGIVFKDISEKVREEIISFIFEYQRKMRKKGLI